MRPGADGPVNLSMESHVLGMTQPPETTPPAVSDEALALRLKEGDEAAFEELVRRHQGRVYAVAYRVTGNREDARDVAQEALLKAYRKIHTWQPTAGFAPWLYRLTTNQAIDSVRRRKRRQHEPLDEAALHRAEQGALDRASLDAERLVRAGEIDDRLRAALDVLSPAQRTVFELRHFEGYQLAEIAPVLGCTVGSVKVHMFRALKKLQKELGDLQAQR